MSVTVAGINFDHHEYDQRADVLYLSVEGYQGPPAHAFAGPEGTASSATSRDELSR